MMNASGKRAAENLISLDIIFRNMHCLHDHMNFPRDGATQPVHKNTFTLYFYKRDQCEQCMGRLPAVETRGGPGLQDPLIIQQPPSPKCRTLYYSFFKMMVAWATGCATSTTYTPR